MSRLDWGRIKKVASELSEMSPDDIDIMYEMISNIEEVDEIKETDKLQDALQVSLHIMMTKAEENRNNIEDLEKSENEIKKLQDVLKELEGENAELQRGGAGGGIDVVREKRNWDMEREQMQEDVRRLKSDNNVLRSEKDSRESRVQELDEEVQRLRDENKKQADNVEFLRERTNQLKSQKDQNQDVKKSEQAYTRSELRQKKIDLDNAQQRMLELHQEIDSLKENLQQATDEIERLTEEYRRMKGHFGSSDMELQSRDAQLHMLQTQLDHLQEQLADKNDSDDQIMSHVNSQVEKWKQIMGERDSEILKLYQENEKLRRELQASGVNTEKANVQALIKVVKEREQQVKELTVKLVEATQTIEENSDIIASLKKDLDKTGGGSAGYQMRRIKELSQKLSDKEQLLKELQHRVDNTESQASDREQELQEVLERNRLYERGEYGLAEAVGEIKAAKAQVALKERQVEGLCQEVNRSELALEELRHENGHLRSKLGIPIGEVLDVEGYKRQRAAEEEEERAINIVLQKEIEKLEDERLMLKKKVRVLARQAGLRAGSAGMGAEDVMEELRTIENEEGINGLTETMTPYYIMGTNKAPLTDRTWKIKEKEASKELTRVIQDLERKETENGRLLEENERLQKEHGLMLEGLQQLRDNMVQGNNSSSRVPSVAGKLGSGGGLTMLECPVLDKLLNAMETRRLVIGSGGVSQLDSGGLFQKTRIDNLEGRNAELRQELRESRVELEKARVEYSRLASGRGGGSGVGWHGHEDGQDEVDWVPSLLPPVSGQPENTGAAHTIAGLRQQLVVVLQEKARRDAVLDKVDADLQRLRRKFAVIRHQQGLLYRDHADLKQKFEADKTVLQSKLDDAESQRTQDSVRLKEFDNLLLTLSKDESEIKKQLSQLTRDRTLLRVNEAVLDRKFSVISDMEQSLRRENNQLKNEMIQMEAVVTERMGYYRRFKETANYKLTMLQKQLDESVARSELTDLQTRFDELTEKYRNFLEQQNFLIGRGQSIGQLEQEHNKLRQEHETGKKLLETEKQKRAVLEEALNELSAEQTYSEDYVTEQSDRKFVHKSVKTVLSDAHLIAITKKVATLEMKELNERERAEHYMRQYDNMRKTFDQAESRNKELEEKVSSLTGGNLALQRQERELRDDLEQSVTRDLWEGAQRRLGELEGRELAARHEKERLREVAEVARSQADRLWQQQASRDRAAAALQQQMLELQSRSDDAALLGRLHRLVLQLQLSEAAALRKLDDSQRREKTAEARLRREELCADDKDQALFCTRAEARDRVRHLRDTVNSLRSQFSGSIPLAKQERFTETLVRLTQEKATLDKDLQQLVIQKHDVETELEKERLVEAGRLELVRALQDHQQQQLRGTRGAEDKATLTSWHQKMEVLRLDELRQRRQVDLLSHQVEHLESVVRCQEAQLAQTEQELARASRQQDEREANWESREVQLETALGRLEATTATMTAAAPGSGGRRDDSSTLLLDKPEAPLPVQLEHAVTVARANIRLVADRDHTIRGLNQKGQETQAKLRDLEGKLLQRERYVTELRLRLPASTDRAHQLGQIFTETEASLLAQPQSNYADDKAVWAAQTSLAGLQERLDAKDDCVLRLEKLLKEAREDLMQNNQRRDAEMEEMRRYLASRPVPIGTKQNQQSSVSGEQLQRLRETEEQLLLERNCVLEQRQQLEEQARQLEAVRRQHEEMGRVHEARKNRGREDAELVRQDRDRAQRDLAEQDIQIQVLKKETERARAEARQSPKVELMQEAKRLRETVKDREGQVLELKSMVQQLKQELLDMLQRQPEIRQKPGIGATAARELDDVRDQLLTQQKETRQLRGEKEALVIELDGFKREAADRESGIRRLKAEKSAAETVAEELRGQLKRLKNIRVLSNDNVKQDLDEVRLKMHLVEEENTKLKRAVSEVPLTCPTGAPLSVPLSATQQWGDQKKLERSLGKTRDQLSEMEINNNKMRKQLDTVNRAMDRMKREKQVLENRLTERWGPGALLEVDEDAEKIVARRTGPQLTSPDRRERIGNSDIARESHVATEVALKEAEMRNRILQKNVDDLERRLVHTGNASGIHLEKERAMQKEIIRLNGDNLQQKFEVESLRKEVPRLKEKVIEQQRYIDLLRSEKEAKDDVRSQRSIESAASTISSIRKIGESGKSTYELEKTVARMKKLVEKTQRENERLKEAPGVVMNEQLEFARADRDRLQQELEELRQQMGARLAERYDAKEKGTARIVQEHERLRRDLAKEVDQHEKTRVDLKMLARQLEQSEKTRSELEAKLAIAESRGRQTVPRRGQELLEDNHRLESVVADLQSQLDRQDQSSERAKIEDLKAAFKKVSDRNAVLERQLKLFSEQFGVDVDQSRR